MTTVAILSFPTISMSQAPLYLPTDSLVGWYPFSASPNDESGNGYHGTRNGASLVNDRHGNATSAYSFDGVNEYITLDRTINVNFGQSYTQSCWIYLYNTNGSGPIGSKGRPWATPRVVPQTNKVQFYADASGHTSAVIAETGSINPKVWYHFTFVKDSNSYLIYMNGVLADSVYDSYTINPTKAVYRIAASSPSFPFEGVIDDFAIWNRALNHSEVSAVYRACESRTSTQVQPSDTNVLLSQDASFNLETSLTSGVTFQWQTDLGTGFQSLTDAGQFTGTQTKKLLVSNVTMANNNQKFRCVINDNGCSDTSNVAVLTVNNNVGINEFTRNNLFSVYPNPAKSQINVKADAKLLGSIYTVYDNTGKLVLTGKIISENTTIELGNLSGGIYLFSVGENMKQTFKVIKE